MSPIRPTDNYDDNSLVNDKEIQRGNVTEEGIPDDGGNNSSVMNKTDTDVTLAQQPAIVDTSQIKSVSNTPEASVVQPNEGNGEEQSSQDDVV
ncbi:unnamed protein product [Caenorhabditis nigoni]|uniref:Uncharacterized protein n=1 Tax=Caenorhabditis nigoni TaxID=1611254 RepID=A0A2G5VUN7_9PELO|nr:hypothetical protein B9Z55_000737 [Caenorhabditis nigoni]